MSAPWDFQPNCYLDVWMSTMGIPGGAATYTGIYCQHMRPFYQTVENKTIIFHRLIVETAAMPIPSSTDIFNGVVVNVYDDAPHQQKYLEIHDCSPFFYNSSIPSFECDHFMLIGYQVNA